MCNAKDKATKPLLLTVYTGAQKNVTTAYSVLLVLCSSCLATKVLIGKYVAARRVVVSGGWAMG